MDFLFRIAILAVGYFYPAYKCFKVVNCSRPKLEQLHVWCQYWVIIAVFTGLERIADVFLSWLPFYSGAKLMFVVYLWHPDTQGTEYVYHTLLKPLLSKHEEAIDLNWVHVRNEALELVTLLWSNLLAHAQLKLSELSRQNALHSQQAATQPVHVYPLASYSLRTTNLPLGQNQQQLLYPTMAHSAILPREQYQCPPQVSNFKQASVAKVTPGKHMQTVHLSSSHVQPGQKAALNTEATMAPTLCSSGELKGHATKEEHDFELVNPSEVVAFGASDVNQSNISAQRARSRWWWWWQ